MKHLSQGREGESLFMRWDRTSIGGTENKETELIASGSGRTYKKHVCRAVYWVH